MNRLPFPVKVMLWIVLFLGALGLLAGTLNLLNPKAVFIPGGSAPSGLEGIEGLIASLLSSLAMGFIIGVPAGVLTWLLDKSTKKKTKEE